ncbi:MAG: tetratricopeptide repeat protein [candidate division NC10 bacterium]|nr:tetratricopeptide repeat protein [candidate division NC10 bacterium]
MTIALFALLFATVVFTVAWPLLRGHRPAAVPPEGAPDPRHELLRQKGDLYGQIRDLDFDYAAGSIAEADYRQTRAQLEAAAAETLKALEALGGGAAVPLPPSVARGTPRPHRRTHGLRLGLLLTGVLGLGLALGYFLATSLGPRGPDGSPTGSVGGLGMGRASPPASADRRADRLENARALVDQGEVGRAFEIYRGILERDPRNVEAITQLGVILARARSFDEAHLAFDKALSVDPSAPLPLWEKGLAYFQAGRPRDGVKVWEHLIAVAPTDARAVMARRMITQVRESMSRPAEPGGAPR